MAASDVAIELMGLRLTMPQQEAEAMEGGNIDLAAYLIERAELEVVLVGNNWHSLAEPSSFRHCRSREAAASDGPDICRWTPEETQK